MRRRSALVAAVLVVTGLVAARAATTSSAPTRSEAPPQAADPPASPPVERAASAIAVAPSAAPAIAVPAAATAATAAAEAPRERADANVPRTTDVLLEALGSSDPFVVLTAADDLAARKATRAVPILAAIDIRKSAHSAPSVINALGRLASGADSASRTTATDRLLALLAQERVRSAPESSGNVLALYEALGRTLDPRAAAALEAELVDPTVTHAAKTVVVAALVRLQQPSSGPPLRALQRELGVFVAKSPLEEEVRGELAVAVERALRAVP